MQDSPVVQNSCFHIFAQDFCWWFFPLCIQLSISPRLYWDSILRQLGLYSLIQQHWLRKKKKKKKFKCVDFFFRGSKYLLPNTVFIYIQDCQVSLPMRGPTRPGTPKHAKSEGFFLVLKPEGKVRPILKSLPSCRPSPPGLTIFPHTYNIKKYIIINMSVYVYPLCTIIYKRHTQLMVVFKVTFQRRWFAFYMWSDVN